MDSDDPIHESVEEMAKHYVSEMRSVQPHGPYLIGGHCSGSWVAFEMAHQLQALGERVDLLVLVDFGPPQHHVRRVNPLRYVVERLEFYRADGRLADAVRWKLGLAKERLVVRWLGGARAKRAAEVRARHAVAHARYEPTPIAGGAVLVRTAESVQLRDRAWHLDWRKLLSGPLRVDVVGGTHAGLVEDANSAELAAVISRSIAGVRRGAATDLADSA
jgi:thioesterase domain-containing protein